MLLFVIFTSEIFVLSFILQTDMTCSCSVIADTHTLNIVGCLIVLLGISVHFTPIFSVKAFLIIQVKDDGEVSLKHRLIGHEKPVVTVSWSPDDKQLLTCGQEEVVRRWDVCSGECLNVYEKAGVGLVSCGWFPDGKGIFSGMTDRSICLWDLDGKELECWKGQRTLKISDMAITDDGRRIISVSRDTAILLFDRESGCERWIEELDVITSFSLSKDNKFLLVNLINQEIHLWSIEGDPKVVSKYKGYKRARFVIRSCFGGFEQAFIASGSEDSQVLFSFIPFQLETNLC